MNFGRLFNSINFFFFSLPQLPVNKLHVIPYIKKKKIQKPRLGTFPQEGNVPDKGYETVGKDSGEK